MRKSNILSIQGNYDKAIGNSKSVCGCDYKDERQLEMAGLSVLFTNMTVTENNRAFLQLKYHNMIEGEEFKMQ